MNELLSPAGTIESFYAAISNGADAIYLGLDKFSARAYATNFNIENLTTLVPFAHLRNVKIYVTINTIIYDDELEDCFETIDQLANIGVDAIIVQDLAILTYISNKYKSLKAHVSTQVGIDDIDGTKLVLKLGATRVVYAREVSIDTLKNIKNETGVEMEAFIHGALCVGYSGNCLMSSLIGDRSGNRGRCAGCCRKLNSLVNTTTNTTYETGYLLSMKDLNTSSNIQSMRFIDSFKIEGRMKEPTYVAAVTNTYRKIIDGVKTDKDNLNKVFNRTYTKGYINNEIINNITNIEKPNNYGYEIGVVERVSKNKIFIRLNKTLNRGDQIRIESKNKFEEISIPVLRLYDSSFKLVDSMNKLGIVESDKLVEVGMKVYKTKDILFNNETDRSLLNKEYSKLNIDMEFNAYIGKPIFIKVTYDKYKAFIKSDFIVEQSITNPTTKENILNQLEKLNDTPYKLRNVAINIDDNIFIPLKLINELRRDLITKLNKLRLDKKVVINDKNNLINPPEFNLHKPIISVSVSNINQYNLVKSLGIEHIYFDDIVRRNNSNFIDSDKEILVGGLNGIEHYKNNKNIVTDYSLNVVNYKTVALLHSLNVNRVTLSHEIDKERINKLVDNYFNEYHTYPNLELIVYGRTKLMHTKYCILKRLGKCDECKKYNFELKDEFASFPLAFNKDHTMTILNSKILNIIDDLDSLKGINYYRVEFYDESDEEIMNIINTLKNKIEGVETNSFNKDINTRGHFIKSPL